MIFLLTDSTLIEVPSNVYAILEQPEEFRLFNEDDPPLPASAEEYLRERYRDWDELSKAKELMRVNISEEENPPEEILEIFSSHGWICTRIGNT